MATKIISRTAVALALALATGVPAAAASVPTRTFKVEVEGRQATSYAYTYLSKGACDPAGRGHSAETLVFHTTKPALLVARLYRAGGKSVVVFSGKHGAPMVRTAARVTRSSFKQTDPLDPACQGTGGGQQGWAPDCGTKTTQLDVTPGWWVRNPTGLTLDSGYASTLDPLFHNCDVGGKAFPYLLSSTTDAQQIVSTIPGRDLFDAGVRKHILIGRGTYAHDDDESATKTTIRWSVALTAVDD